MSTTDSPTSEGSGLADLRSIAASIGVPAAAGAPAAGEPDTIDFEAESGAVLLSPGAGPAPSLADAPLLATPSPLQSNLLSPPTAAATARHEERSRRGLVWALAGSGVLLLGAVGLLALRGGSPNRARAAEAGTPQAPALAAVTPEPSEPSRARPAQPPPSGLAQGLAQGLAGAAADPDDLEEASLDLVLEDDASPTSARARRSTRGPRTHKGTDPTPEPDTADTAAPAQTDGVADPFAGAAEGETPAEANSAAPPEGEAAAPAEGDTTPPPAQTEAAASPGGLSADCVLDPNRPECAGKVPDRPKQAEGPKDDANLPQKLTSIDVRRGFATVKPAAKACGRKHGASSGTKVKVKVSIEGATGKVISAKAIGDLADSPVGTCVSDALRGAQFPRFRAKQMGLTYPVIL